MKNKVFFYSAGRRISALLGFPIGYVEKNKYPAVIINHGYSGNKEEYNDMADELNKNGYVTLQFDSRGCGEAQGIFGRMMCSTEWIEDAYSAVTYMTALDIVDSNRIGYTGCSMGGAVTVYMAANDSRLKCAVALAPLSDGEMQLKDAWTDRKGIGAWDEFLYDIKEDGKRLVVKNESKFVSVPYALCMTKQDEIDFHKSRDEDSTLVRDVPLESVRNSLLQFKPMEHCHKISIPVMFIHGNADFIVPLKHSVRMHDVLNSQKELVIIDGAPHPLPMSDYKYEVFGHAIRWFDRHL